MYCATLLTNVRTLEVYLQFVINDEQWLSPQACPLSPKEYSQLMNKRLVMHTTKMLQHQL